MKKPLTGIPLSLFRTWLYVPLLIIVYVDYQTILSYQKVSWFGLLVAFVGSLFIFLVVFLSKEFRDFNRATPLRIITFFGIAFMVAELFVVVLNALLRDLQWTLSLVTIPGIMALVFAPAMVMRLDFLWWPEDMLAAEPIEGPER